MRLQWWRWNSRALQSPEFFDDIVPHPEGVDPDTDLIHERAYVVRAYRKDAHTLLLRGAVRDQKPPGLYVPNDPEPLTVHHMIVDLHIEVPSLEIVQAKAVLQSCSAGLAGARTPPRCCRPWPRWRCSRCGRSA